MRYVYYILHHVLVRAISLRRYAKQFTLSRSRSDALSLDTRSTLAITRPEIDRQYRHVSFVAEIDKNSVKGPPILVIFYLRFVNKLSTCYATKYFIYLYSFVILSHLSFAKMS